MDARIWVGTLCLTLAAASLAAEEPAAPPAGGASGDGAAAASAAEPTTEERIRAQEERIRALKAQLEALRRELEAIRRQQTEAPRPQPAPPTPAAQPPAAGRPAQRTPTSPGPAAHRGPEVYGYLQSDFDSATDGGERFRVRRARVGVRGELERQFRYYVTGELTSRELLRDAAIQWDGWRGHHFRFGQFLVPFSFEGFESIARLPTIERSMIVDAIYDNREVGIGLFSAASPERRVGYGVALVNGAGRNQFVATPRKQLFARVQLSNPRSQPFLGGHIALGLSTKQGHTFNVRRNRPEDEAYGIDLTFERGRWLARGEWLRGRFDELHVEGFYGLLLYRLRQNLELVGRHEGYFEDGGPFDAHRTTFGLNYYFSPSTRAMLDYDFVTGRTPDEEDTGVRLRLQTLF